MSTEIPANPEPAGSYNNVSIWLAVCLALISMVLMIDISRLLGDIQSVGQHSYSASILTSFKWNIEDTDALRGALSLWFSGSESAIATRLVAWHLLIDIILFVPAYCYLILRLLRRVGANRKTAIAVAVVLFVLDWLETWFALGILVLKNPLSVTDVELGTLQALNSTKWIGLWLAVITGLALWRRPAGASSVENAYFALKSSHQGGPQHPAISLFWISTLVVIFAALVALPAGGPLDQLPDVLRYQLTSDSALGASITTLLIALVFVGAVIAASLAASDPDHDVAQGNTHGSKFIIIGASLASGICFAVARYFDESISWSALSLLFVVAGLIAAYRLAAWASMTSSLESGLVNATAPAPRECAQWVGALAAIVVIATGLAFIRATFPPMLVGPVEERTHWGILAAVAAAATVGGGIGAQYGVTLLAIQTWRRHLTIRRLAMLPCGIAILGSTLLIFVPSAAEFIGTIGVVAIAFASFAAVIGGLKWAARSLPAWDVTVALGFGKRTPWVMLLIATWTLSSILNVDGLYHDARVSTQSSEHSHKYAGLDEAFERWVKAQANCRSAAGNVAPMVLVAAPGGGIRAAYWTVSTLDRLFPVLSQGCETASLFAISAVSGGSVGTVTWMASWARAQKDDKDALSPGLAAVSAMSQDRALATAAAGLLLRDMLQPLTGVRTLWYDRAALLEDGWAESSDIFARCVDQTCTSKSKRPLRWSELGDEMPHWTPVVILNSSSVRDGCRILLSNVAALPVVSSMNCDETPMSPAGGLISGSLDALQGLRARSHGDTKCETPAAGMFATTAALLSARFPLISPSGALRRCAPDGAKTTVTYAVDGGYFENSGILSLLQLWQALEPRVTEYNQSRSDGAPRIIPWIVVADNAYRSSADEREGRRPLETLAPVSALSNINQIVGKNALEQMASVAMRRYAGECLDAEGKPVPFRHLVVISPSREPTVAAPLGWVLSSTTQHDLDAQLNTRMQKGLGKCQPDSDLALDALMSQLATSGQPNSSSVATHGEPPDSGGALTQPPGTRRQN